MTVTDKIVIAFVDAYLAGSKDFHLKLDRVAAGLEAAFQALSPDSQRSAQGSADEQVAWHNNPSREASDYGHRTKGPVGSPPHAGGVVVTEEMRRAGGLAINPDADVLIVTGQEAEQAFRAMLPLAAPQPAGARVEVTEAVCDPAFVAWTSWATNSGIDKLGGFRGCEDVAFRAGYEAALASAPRPAAREDGWRPDKIAERIRQYHGQIVLAVRTYHGQPMGPGLEHGIEIAASHLLGLARDITLNPPAES